VAEFALNSFLSPNMLQFNNEFHALAITTPRKPFTKDIGQTTERFPG